MSILQAEVAVIGAGVVGCASALALARRGVSVALLEAEREPGLAASGTNSGILHTGFDSPPGELETDPVAFTLGLAAAAEAHGAQLRTGFRVAAMERRDGAFAVASDSGDRL